MGAGAPLLRLGLNLATAVLALGNPESAGSLEFGIRCIAQSEP